jgi:hypothetical protein
VKREKGKGKREKGKGKGKNYKLPINKITNKTDGIEYG